MLIYFIGPGGAGKTTTGHLLAFQLGGVCYDLDEYFMQIEGDISKYIKENGYQKYASRNVQAFLELQAKHKIKKVSIIVCSSGFMTYSDDVHQDYLKIKQEVEHHLFTFLLLPSLDFEACVKETLKRQMGRVYLEDMSAEKEELKIRARFKLYTGLNCKIVLTSETPTLVVSRIIEILGK
ncbi:shikimate kinase [Acinetobacter haemolyticus]|uniref:Shikimate kinase n=2 Tax=Acinetobacter haemolyticus TaxID=29430 RepID=A0A4V1ASD4_ACIHA|nr:shikimate kinase [Acinetobacter haemolyticus]MCU4379181.1 hypothetical protein [Acinetobacter haemolyticus]QBQ15109.1 hypothetical protein AHTJR_01890 [Acinetobacter haemolyticus]WHR56754.1 shikimate kinase [Acinetobacter haemolyticus]